MYFDLITKIVNQTIQEMEDKMCYTGRCYWENAKGECKKPRRLPKEEECYLWIIEHEEGDNEDELQTYSNEDKRED